jgi:MoxR-like ATPase
MTKDEYDKCLADAVLDPTLRIEPLKLVLYPHFDVMRRVARLAAAYLTHVTDTDGTHVVIQSYHEVDGEARMDIWCGDKFTEGRKMTNDEARQRCDEAVDGMPNKAKLAGQLMGLYAQQPTSAGCTFWNDFRKHKTLCRHTSHVLAHLRDNVPDFRTQLQTLYESATLGGSTAPVSETLLLDELAFRVPILYEGERGAGKTVTARAFARDNGYKRVELGGHEGIESPDMLGFLVPVDKSTMVWKDGPLSEAFRSAKKQKTVFIIDELLRIRQRELSILLTALSPDDGVYRIRTGRIVAVEDGVAVEEELECPVANLCVVATTNVGSEYAVDDIDPALAERFVILRKDTTPAELKRILTLVAKKHSVDKACVGHAVNFFTKMTELRNRGMVKHAPTTRTLVRAFELSADKGGTLEEVKRGIRTQVLLWVARTAEGHPVPEQVSDVDKLIDRCFK